MRSDFIGDCMDFPGLPEAVNEGLYLVGRMSRDGLRAAITGPVAVAGGTIAPRLVNRVLNDLGDDHDQLPLVQHALMRTWDHWADRDGDRPIDVDDYEAIGTFRNALSKHAEEAYEEAVALDLGHTTQRIFKALTDTFTDPRGVRRPTLVSELAAIAETDEEHVIQAVEIFRRPGRTFLMPPAATALTGRSIVDLSHESLMRCWDRLITWAEQERASAAFYVRLSQAALWSEQGTAGLWRNPELELAQQWKAENEPTATWARRYDPGFDRAMVFLERSLEERDRVAAEIERERRAKLRRTQIAAGAFAAGLAVVAALGMFAWSERQRAQANLDLARQAVDESLAAADRDPAQLGADVPQVEELRRELLSKAERFYIAFMNQEPRSDEARRDLAIAHVRLGHINRMLERRDDAEREYRDAIARLTALATDNPRNASDRQALAGAFNWLGETLRQQAGRMQEAGSAYDSALQIQQALVKEHPDNTQYQEELARTLSNRGILRWGNGDASAEGDFRESLRLLEPLTSGSTRALQEMGRVSNNLAAVLDSLGADDARAFYERAVAGHERLVQQNPANREYQLELATFCNNLAVFLHDRGANREAEQRSRQALALMTDLARPAPSLAIERADAHSLRGMIVQTQSIEEAQQAYENALDLFAEMQTSPAALRMPRFHMRFGDLLINLAVLANEPAAGAASRRLLARGLTLYMELAQRLAGSGAVSETRVAFETLSRVIPELNERDRPRVLAIQEQLRRVIDGRGPS
jgi:tetratricopeptide (TPR) repeat protein